MTLRNSNLSVAAVRCFYVSMVWHSVKVNKLSHVWQFIDLDLHTTDLCITFSSNTTMSRLNIDIFLLYAVILQYLNWIPASLLYFLSLLYSLYFDLVSNSVHQWFCRLHWPHSHLFTLLTHAEIFVMVLICRQFIGGKDWNWQWGCAGVSTINITEHQPSTYFDMMVFAVNVRVLLYNKWIDKSSADTLRVETVPLLFINVPL